MDTSMLDPSVTGVVPSPTLAINERVAALRASGRDVLHLGLGQSPFPVPAHVVSALQEHAHQKDYLPVRGLPALRAAVADHHRRHTDAPATAEDVLIGPGTKELMFGLTLALNATLLLPSPSWVSYAPQARLLKRRVRWIPTDPQGGWRLTPAALEAELSATSGHRLLLLNSPNNPTGAAYTPAELEALAAVAREHGILVLSDEIYSGVHHLGEHASFARYYPEGTVVSNGLSKWCGAGGWRLGAFVFPRELRPLLDAMAVVASESFSAVAAPIQHASVVAYTDEAALADYLAGSRAILAGVGAALHTTLSQVGCTVSPPEGGFYLFAQLPRAKQATGLDLCEALLEEAGVAVLPGSAFGRPAEELSMRLAYVDFDGSAALLGAAQGPIDDAFLERHCSRVLEAGRRIASFASA